MSIVILIYFLILDSLTAEMGVDFNILEYADPELDTLNDGEKANLLDSLELDDGEPDDKKKEVHDKLEYVFCYLVKNKIY